MKKFLFYAIGNPGRGDDGLGNEFVRRMEIIAGSHKDFLIDFDSNYHLNIEDAELLSHYDAAFIVDASEDKIDDFAVKRVIRSPKGSFTSHSVSPEYLAELTFELFGSEIPLYALHIKGSEWELGSQISTTGKTNLEKAINFFKNLLSDSSEFSKFTNN